MTADGSDSAAAIRADQRVFYESAHPKLLRLLRKHLPDPHTAEDVAIEVWKAFMVKWNREASTFSPSLRLLCRIAHCQWSNWWRDHGSKAPELHSDLDGLAEVLICQDGVDALVSRIDLSRAIARALTELPSRQRQAVQLRYIDDLPMTQVGDMMGITTRGARKAVAHALAALRASSYLTAYADQAIGRPGDRT